MIGDNNTGKSTILEAIDLVLGPDRLSRQAPIDEHDFYVGRYWPNDSSDFSTEDTAGATTSNTDETHVDDTGDNDTEPDSEDATNDEIDEESKPWQIRIEATVTDLASDQQARFKDYIEWWDTKEGSFYTSKPVEGVDAVTIIEALRVTTIGQYVVDEDDFEGKTYFARSLEESDNPQQFYRRDKQHCGFLYLRSLRTGKRALSLERGSLLDIILRLKEIRPQMWETAIRNLALFDVASDPELGVSGVLESINTALSKYVPREWGVDPHLRVSALTRNHLRNIITAFIATGEGNHAAPYYSQGTGTINMLVLAMLSQIAKDKKNVIFAMEEPETAIPPYAQKRIVHELRKISAQSILTSHSPYVLEEFDLGETVVLTRSDDGLLSQSVVSLPESVKHKRYQQEFRTRFCEGLLSRRILLVEGATEATAFPAVARHLAELDPTKYSSLEVLGICTINAGSETQIVDLGSLYCSLGKTVYGACDKQLIEKETTIKTKVDELFMHPEKGFEDLVIKNTTREALERFADLLTWPQYLLEKYPVPKDNIVVAIGDYFRSAKGSGGIADFLTQCTEEEIPEWLRDTCTRLRALVRSAVEDFSADTNEDVAKIADSDTGVG